MPLVGVLEVVVCVHARRIEGVGQPTGVLRRVTGRIGGGEQGCERSEIREIRSETLGRVRLTRSDGFFCRPLRGLNSD
jgi:hypothetical protein